MDGKSEKVDKSSELGEERVAQMPLTPIVPSAQLTRTPATCQLPYTMDPGPSFMHLNDTKAGMGGLDKEKINQIILKASKDSAYFKRQQGKQKRLDEQIADLLHRKSKVTKEQLKHAEAVMDAKASKLESKRTDMSRIIVHMDMDMFFAAVEMRDDPKLASVPMAVGSYSMLSTSNYEARKFGVRAGMAGFIAKELCPKLVIKTVDMKKYIAASRQVMSIVAQYDPEYRSASVDEAYMDLTEYVLKKYSESVGEEPVMQPLDQTALSYPIAVWQMAAEVVSEMRSQIKDTTKLTCSAGVAHNKMIAKVCTDMNKPDGQYLMAATSRQAVDDFVTKMRVRKISGIGQVQEQLLKALDIETCGDLYAARGLIQLLSTPANIDFYLRVSLGIGSNVVTEAEDHKRKSLSSETTFKVTTDVKILNKHLQELSSAVSADLKKEQLSGKTITLIIKWATFVLNDRSKSLSFPTNDEKVIRETVQSILKLELEKKPDTAIRLLGVRVSNFADEISSSSSSSVPSAAKKPKSSGKQKPITEFVKQSPNVAPTVSQSSSSYSSSSKLHSAHDFVCIYCLTQFTNESSLEQHLDQKACPGLIAPQQLPEITSFTCPVCSSTFPGLTQLNHHLDQCLLK